MPRGSTAESAPRWSRFTPGLASLLGYQRAWLRFDVLAGVTVAAYLIPQCMSYAEIAGLPPVVGLWAILPPMVLYAVFGSSRQLSVGPESTTAIMTAAAVAPLAASGSAEYAALCAAMALLVGLVCIVAWLARLGFLANLLSRPILAGYLAGVALIMISGQLGKVTGVEIEGDRFFEEIADFLSKLDQVSVATAALAVGVLVFLFLLQHVAPKLPGPLLAVGGSALVVWLFGLDGHGISVVGSIPAGLPSPALPDVALGDLDVLVAAALGIALVGYSDNVLTARAFAGRSGVRVDPDQELLALGTGNLGAGFFQGFPISSSGSRTVIGDSLGSRSQVYSLVAFVTVIITLLFLRPVLEQFPNAALGALVIFAATKLVEIPEFRALLAFRRTEFGLALATTAGVLLTDILVGVLVAVALSVVDLFARIADPHDAALGRVPGLGGWHDVDDWPDAEAVPGLVLYRYDGPLFFANADDFRDRALATIEQATPPAHWVVFQAEAIARIDSTAASMLGELLDELRERDVVVGFAEVKQELRAQLRRCGLDGRIGDDRFYATVDEAVAAFVAAQTGAGSGDGAAPTPGGDGP